MSTPDNPDGSNSSPTTDGRNARRERGKAAVIDAALDEIMAGRGLPASPRLAELANVSAASVFRYFSSLDELRVEAISQYFGRYGSMFEIPDSGKGPLMQRIETLAAARVQQHVTTQHMARFVRTEMTHAATFTDALHQIRMIQAEQIRVHFATELDEIDTELAEDIVGTLSVLTAFESWNMLVSNYLRTAEQVRRSWESAMAAMFEAHLTR